MLFISANSIKKKVEAVYRHEVQNMYESKTYLNYYPVGLAIGRKDYRDLALCVSLFGTCV